MKSCITQLQHAQDMALLQAAAAAMEAITPSNLSEDLCVYWTRASETTGKLQWRLKGLPGLVLIHAHV